MDKLIHLFQTMGPFALMPILFVVVGAGMWLNVLWGLATGGPRALQQPGAPYLYDRVYYLLWLVMIAGWTMCLLSFASGTEPGFGQGGFFTGWGIMAVGMGLIFVLKRRMFLEGSRYLAQHGFWLFRFFHAMQTRQFSEERVATKIVPPVFLVIGIGILIFNLFHIPEALQQAEAGARTLLGYVTTP